MFKNKWGAKLQVNNSPFDLFLILFTQFLKLNSMKLTTFSVVWTVLYLGFGLGLLFIPVTFMSMYGVSLDANGVLMTRILGSALTSIALIFYLNRNINISETAQYNFLLAGFIYNVVDFPVVLMATINGVMNSMGWFPVVLHAFLAATMGYFVFSKDKTMT